MKLRQFKLTNNDEIVCEVMDVDESDNHNGDIIARKILKVFHAEDFDQNVRYYSFKPWVSFQEDINELSAINPDHILGEATPSSILKLHFKNALDIILESQNVKGKKSLNIDEVMMDTTDMSRDEIAEYLKDKFYEEQFSELQDFQQDSSQTNVIHLFPPSDKIH